jgi:predicted phage tail protein
MRGFIRFCGGLFVVTGVIVLVVGLLVSVAAAKMSDFQGGIAFTIGGLVTIFGAAGVTLIGGVAYMLCSIDHRLETMNQQIQDGRPPAETNPQT